MMDFLLRFNFLYRLLGPKDDSRAAARERLRSALVGDRSKVAGGFMDSLREEVNQVLGRYMEFDGDKAEFALRENDGQMTFTARVPIKRVHRQAHLPKEALEERHPSGETAVKLQGKQLRKRRRRKRESVEASAET